MKKTYRDLLSAFCLNSFVHKFPLKRILTSIEIKVRFKRDYKKRNVVKGEKTSQELKIYHQPEENCLRSFKEQKISKEK